VGQRQGIRGVELYTNNFDEQYVEQLSWRQRTLTFGESQTHYDVR
jgi:hypothetical protein